MGLVHPFHKSTCKEGHFHQGCKKIEPLKSQYALKNHGGVFTDVEWPLRVQLKITNLLSQVFGCPT